MSGAFDRLGRHLLFALDPETAHGLSIAALKSGVPLCSAARSTGRLATRIAGIDFPNPLGLAAGYDKNAEAPGGLLRLGFGFVEIGTVTPLPQSGNPRPRIFRLPRDGAVINRLGFNNEGHEKALARLRRRRGGGVVGVNIGANKDSADRIADYELGVRRFAGVTSYLAVNISSPNTPGLRDLQHGPALADLLARAAAARGTTPLFLKVAPDQEPTQIDEIARAAIDAGIDALIVGNTTVSRPPLSSAYSAESGGLSGAPLATLAAQRLRDFRAATGGALPLVAVGGIDSGAEAYARIRAGASLVQLYTGLVYGGAALPARIVREMEALMRRDGFAQIAEAIGAG